MTTEDTDSLRIMLPRWHNKKGSCFYSVTKWEAKPRGKHLSSLKK